MLPTLSSYASAAPAGESSALPTPPSRGFAVAEFEARLENAQRRMRSAGLNALLLTTEPEVRYFSGFLTQFWESPTRPFFLVVPDQGKPIAVVPEIAASLMRATWLDDVRSWPSPRPDDEGVSLLAATLRDITTGGVVGILGGSETTLRMPLTDFRKLQDSLPGVAFDDATDLVRALRMVKSEAEIDKIRHICRVASHAFTRVPQLLTQEQPLSGLFRQFRIELMAAGADHVPYLVGASELGGYDCVIAPPSDEPPRPGDVLMLDTGAVYDGYFCDFDRNYSIGAASELTRRGYEALYRATEAGLTAARPGTTCTELFTAMQSEIERAGFAASTIGRMGHGLGMQLTEWPSHRVGDETVLTPGMVITLEPALEVAPGRGMVHEENLVIREDGVELLSLRAAETIPELIW